MNQQFGSRQKSAESFSKPPLAFQRSKQRYTVKDKNRSVAFSRNHNSREDQQHPEQRRLEAVTEQGPRQRSKLMNEDGTELTVPDYLKAVNEMKQSGESGLKIANFGLKKSAFATHQITDQKKEIKHKKKKDYMTSIMNSQRLLSQYAKEERKQFEDRLKSLGVWTKRNELKNQSLVGKTDLELYQRLESSMVEGAHHPNQLENTKNMLTRSHANNQFLQNKHQFAMDIQNGADTVSQDNLLGIDNDYQPAEDGVQMQAQDENVGIHSQNDLIFATEIDPGLVPSQKHKEQEPSTTNVHESTKISERDKGGISSLMDLELYEEQAQFKNVVRELVKKDEATSTTQLEQRIADRMQK